MQNITDTYPLSPSQNIMRLMRVTSDSLEPSTIGFIFRVKDNANPDAMEKALMSVIAHNDALRLRFFKKGFKWRQKVMPVGSQKLNIERVRMTEEEYDAFIHNLSVFKITWDDEIYIWARLICRADGDWSLVVRLNHAIIDGYSLCLVFQQLEKAYDDIILKNEPDLGKQFSVIDSYKDDIEYLKSQQYKDDWKFWLKKFRPSFRFSYPTGYYTMDSASKTKKFCIDKELFTKYQGIISEHRVTIATIILALAAVNTYVLSDKKFFCLNTLIHSRYNFKQKKTVGCRMSYIPVFADVNPDIKLSEFIDWFYTSYMESMVHSRFPALNMPIVTYLQCVVHGFNFNIPWFYLSQMDFASVAKESKYEFSTTPVSNADNNIYLSLFNMKDSISIGFEYQTKLEKRFDMERVLRSVDVILELAPEYMERPIMELKDRVISSI